MPANEANPIYPSERERRDLEALVRQQTCAQAAFVQQPRMRLAMDNLNTHYSESAVLLVAERIGFEGDLGRKGRCGILRNAASRQTFLSDPEHPLGFHFTPKHASWLNQIEIWFSILVRKLITV